ncbi:hypothetical protein BGZ51_005142 [Haplosporangium sp. Z 767]|nr:hypothetical protein BGZ51_005142 [Haplosporangium sp. Z 767]KAF9182122.1 hypothetical protein BGZ50_005112 [Haplosporangium sp. Z 11]
MPAACSYSLGLCLTGPLVLNVLTAPTERVKLFLQAQDEVIFNLRQESLTQQQQQPHNQHHHRCQDHYRDLQHLQQSTAGACPLSTESSPLPSQPSGGDNRESKSHDDQTVSNEVKQDMENENGKNRLENDDEEEDEEPRSIIVPYAQLPYKDMQDCFQRLVEKEGWLSLWRGYPLECVRFLLQSRVESRLYQLQFLDPRKWFSVTMTMESEGVCAKAGWILGAALEGTMVSAVALLALYPLAVLQTKMATDIVRKTRRIKRTTTRSSSTSLPSQSSRSLPSEDKNLVVADAELLLAHDVEETEPSPQDSVVWVENAENQISQDPVIEDSTMSTTQEDQPVKNTTAVQEYEYDLSYKYCNVHNAYLSTVHSSEGYLGLYKGFSTVLASTFIVRMSSLTIYHLLSPILSRSSGVGASTRGGLAGLGAFLLVLGTTSVVNLMVYPLSTICHRRMIAAPGRYSSSWDAGKQIVEKQGWKALYKGIEVATIKSVVVAVMSQIF